MIHLRNHQQFQTLLHDPVKPKDLDPISIIKFGATWCGPCKRIDTAQLLNLSDQIVWYECDVDDNEETSAYCGVSSIPCFMAVVNGVPQPMFQSSDTQQVIQWMQRGFKKA
jgi:thioredoxin-like negative regulator of GroEL